MKTSSRFSTQILMFLIQKYCFIIAFSVQQSRSRRKWVSNTWLFMPATCWGSLLCLCEKQAWLQPQGTLLLCQPVASGAQPGLRSLAARDCQNGVRGAVLAAPSAHFTGGRLREARGQGRVGQGGAWAGVGLGHSRELSLTPEGGHPLGEPSGFAE